MKFIISSSELLAYLQSLSRVVPSRAVVPLVENFLFDISSEGLKITATDLETTLIAQLELDNIEGEGKVAIEAKRILDILKEFSQQPLTFEISEDKGEVLIRTETGKYSIPGIFGVDEFPVPAQITSDVANSFVVNPSVLRKGIGSTFFAISEDELRPVMNGIFFQLKTDSITFVSSDSHKLVRYRRSDFSSENDGNFILPKKPADLLRNILTKVDEDIKIEFDDKNVVFEMPNYKVVCRLIEGNFPDYEAVLPQNNDKKVSIDKVGFQNVIKRVSLFSNEASKLVKFFFKENQVEITAQDIDFSISAIEVLNCLYEDEPIRIGFKSTFVVDILQNMTCQDVSLSMIDARRAALMFPTTYENPNEDILVLIMPLMIDDEIKEEETDNEE